MPTIYEKGLTERRESACGIVTSTYGNLILYVKDVIDNPTQTRVRPVGLALTALPKQLRALAYPVKYDQRVRVGTKTCGGVTYPYYLWYYKRIVWTLPTPVYHLDWALALRQKLQEDKVSFAETIGEWRESVKYLEGGANVVAKAAKQAQYLWRHRKDRRKLRKWYKSTFSRDPSSRLELMDAVTVDLAIKFGVNPNIAMLSDIVQTLPVAFARHRRLQVTVSDTCVKTTPNASGWVGERTSSGTKSIRAICYVTYNHDDSNFSSGNLAESIWAGIPLSFVIDWFLDVGSYLSSFNGMNGVSSFTGVLCTRETIIGKNTYRPGETATTSVVNVVPGRSVWQTYERSLISSIPYASFPRPRVPQGFLWQKLLSATEILASLRRGR